MSNEHVIDDSRIIAGRIIRVKNKNKKKFSNSSEYYNCIWIEDSDGGNERCLTFTDSELKMFDERSEKIKDIWPKKSFITNLLD